LESKEEVRLKLDLEEIARVSRRIKNGSADVLSTLQPKNRSAGPDPWPYLVLSGVAVWFIAVIAASRLPNFRSIPVALSFASAQENLARAFEPGNLPLLFFLLGLSFIVLAIAIKLIEVFQNSCQ
jgi:hypothetical protein